MSPEQAQGERVDTRSDIFSLGIVFYEMLTGRRPFEGGNPASVISAILRDTPRPVNELQPAVPRALARLVDRCLAKNPVDRFQSAIDLRHSLEEVEAGRRFGRRVPGVRSGAGDTALGHEARCDGCGRRRAGGRSRRLLARVPVATGRARPASRSCETRFR